MRGDSIVPHSQQEEDAALLSIATRQVVEVEIDACLGEAAQLMAERRISCVVVTDGTGNAAGIVTESDILDAMVAGRDPATPLHELSLSPAVAAPSVATVREAYGLCRQRNIRHLLVVDERGATLGIVSETDFRRHIDLAALVGMRRIGAIAKRSGIALPPTASLSQALQLMSKQGGSCVIVVEDRRPIGIVTKRDAVRFYSGACATEGLALAEAMSSPVVSVPHGASVRQTAEAMLACGLRHLAVVDDAGRLVGLASEHDLVQAMLPGAAEERAGMEERFLRTLLNSLPDLVWLKDEAGVYLSCNARFERFAGAQEADIVGKTDYDLMDRERADLMRAYDREILESGRSSVSEDWIRFADDGHREFAETIRTPMRDREGRPIGVLGVARDITQRLHADIALRASEEKLRGLYEMSPMGIALTDMQGQYLEFNDAFREICGYAREELNKLDYWSLTPKEYADREAEQLEALKARGCYGPYEKEYIRKDGTRIPLRLSGVLIRDHEGTPYIWSIVEDISERRRAEESLLKQKRFSDDVIDSLPGIFYILDRAGRFVRVNPRLPQVSGYTMEELGGMSALELFDPEDRELVEDCIRKAFMTGTSWVEAELVAKTGRRTPYYFSGRLTVIDGESYLVGLGTDIAERKRAENALREREEIYSSIVNQAADSILLIDGESMRFAEFNRMAHESLGYTREEFAALTLADVQAEFDAEQIRRILDDATASGRPLLLETRHRRKDGSIRSSQVTSRAIRIRGKRYFSSIWSDITARKEAETKLQQSEAHFRFVTESAQALIWMSGVDKRCTWFNKVWLDFTGRTMEQELFEGWTKGVHPEDLIYCYESYVGHFDRREPFCIEYRLRRHDGKYRWVMDYGRPRYNAQGVFEGYIGSCFDITDRKRNEENLRITASVFETVQEAIVIADARNCIIDVNPAFTRITGYAKEEVLGLNPKFLGSGVHDRDFYVAMWRCIDRNKSWRGEVWNRRKNGELYAELLSITAICDKRGRVQRYVGVFSDISHIKAHEAALSRIAHYDALTGIPNRVLLADRMKQAIARSLREGKTMAVCYLDLDGFKPINDTLGHEAGDQVLIETTRRIAGAIRAGDTVARLGGDEFVVLLLDLDREEEYVPILERILETVAYPIEVRERSAVLGVSIGVSVYPLHADNPEILLQQADRAMYAAKQAGKHCYRVHDPDVVRPDVP